MIRKLSFVIGTKASGVHACKKHSVRIWIAAEMILKTIALTAIFFQLLALPSKSIWADTLPVLPEHLTSPFSDVRQNETFASAAKAELFFQDAAYDLKSVHIRKEHGKLTGKQLASALIHYSERGQQYVDTLRWLISHYRLDELDNCRIDDQIASALIKFQRRNKAGSMRPDNSPAHSPLGNR